MGERQQEFSAFSDHKLFQRERRFSLMKRRWMPISSENQPIACNFMLYQQLSTLKDSVELLRGGIGHKDQSQRQKRRLAQLLGRKRDGEVVISVGRAYGAKRLWQL